MKNNEETIVFRFTDKNKESYEMTKDGKILDGEKLDVLDNDIADKVITSMFKSQKLTKDKKFLIMSNLKARYFSNNVKEYILDHCDSFVDKADAARPVYWKSLVLVKDATDKLEKAEAYQYMQDTFGEVGFNVDGELE